MSEKKKYDVSVLLAEDDLASRVFASTVFKTFAREVFAAADGYEGLELYKEKSPDLIVSDISMPKMNGLEMSRLIRETDPNIPIILTTAFDNKETLLEAIDVGINQFIVKPLQKERLISAFKVAAERIEMRKSLAQKTEYIETLSKAMENSSSMIIILNRNEEIEYVNPKFCEVSGYEREEVIGKSPEILIFNDETLRSYNEYQEAFEKNKEWHGEFVNNRKNGEPYWVQASISPIKTSEGPITHFVMVFEDVTDKKKVEEELKSANEELERRVFERTVQLRDAKEKADAANQAKTLFLAKVSHELRTPMNGILGMTSILLDSPLNEKQKRSLGVVKYSANSLLKIINDILDFSKLETGKLRIENSDFNLKALINRAVEPLRANAQDKGLYLKTRLGADLPENVNSDALRLQQILTNLIGNAVKFTERGGIVLSANLESQNDERIVVKFVVEDTGLGIPKNMHDKLFKSFSQIDGSLTRKYGGTGLGLSITKELVERMNGEISVESEKGEGSKFAFTIGFNAPENKEKTAESDMLDGGEELSAIAAKFPDYPLQILVAEDSFINREVIIEALSAKPWRCEIAENGALAVEAFKKSDFDIILMDIQMPEMDGFEATRKIREIEADSGKHIKIIGLTAHSVEDSKPECENAGMDAIVGKPIRWSELFGTIVEHTKSKEKTKTTTTKPKINIEKLLDTINNNEKILLNIIDYFSANYPAQIARLRASAAAKDFESLKQISHKFKSELGNFSAVDAVAIAKGVEKLSENKALDSIVEKIDALEAELSAINRLLLVKKNEILKNRQVNK